MSDDKKPFHNPFGSLSRLRGESAPAPRTAKEAARPAAGVPRAVVRLERTGRRGKAVTVITHLDLDPVEQERWLTALKTALGCGGSLEGQTLVLQGDQRDRLPRLLTSRGIRRITVA